MELFSSFLGIGLVDGPVSERLDWMAVWFFLSGASLLWAVDFLRKRAQLRKSELRRSRAEGRLHQVFCASSDVLYRYDLRAHCFDYLSPACFRMTGLSADELCALSGSELLKRIHPEDLELIDAMFRGLSDVSTKGEDARLTFRWRHQDGQYRSVLGLFKPELDSAGRVAAFCGSMRDISSEVRMEARLRTVESKFQQNQKMADLGLLASGIAHDFNNLMTVVLGNSELALMECGGEDHGPLDEIKRTTLRAAELANQMLVYTGKTTCVFGAIDLCSVVREMTALLDVSIPKKVRIEYELGERLPPIQGDVSQIRQVAMNLITNASEAIGDHPGVIAISIQKKRLKAGELEESFPPGRTPVGSYVCLEVSDTGCGMDERTRQKIFDPLFTTKESGKGLGLASLLNAVDRHDGVIDVQSAVGCGTTFRVYFPVNEVVVEGAADSPAANASPWRGYGSVLIADDEPAIRDMLSSLLARMNFHVITASDGLDAVDQYLKYAEDITLLLMDINMPSLDGEEAVRRIRHISPRVPVLLISGYPQEHIMRRFADLSGVEFVKKPFQKEKLEQAIRRVLNGS